MQQPMKHQNNALSR